MTDVKIAGAASGKLLTGGPWSAIAQKDTAALTIGKRPRCARNDRATAKETRRNDRP